MNKEERMKTRNKCKTNPLLDDVPNAAEGNTCRTYRFSVKTTRDFLSVWKICALALSLSPRNNPG